MKPVAVKTKLKLSEAQKKALRDCMGRRMDGEVDVVHKTALPEWEEVRELMLSELRRDGWEFSNRRTPYSNEDITVAGGSVFPHNDSGFGTIAVMPLAFGGGHNKIFSRYAGETEEFSLVTKHGWVIGQAGEILIFNADIWHSWICNRCCAMYTMTVKRLRKRKGVLG
jgi:hypothetical protein